MLSLRQHFIDPLELLLFYCTQFTTRVLETKDRQMRSEICQRITLAIKHMLYCRFLKCAVKFLQQPRETRGGQWDKDVGI